MTNYRKIYENHFGNIPVDQFGRTYEIHHIDGNHSNNDISNLLAVSIEDHYKIHYDQGDWGACQSILIRMNANSQTISEMARLESLKRIENGTHNFLDKEKAKINARKRVADGTHHLLGGEISKRVQAIRIANGTHHMLGGEVQRKNNIKRIKDGTHHLIQKKTCPHCGLTGSGGSMYRFHFDKCKKKESKIDN